MLARAPTLSSEEFDSKVHIEDRTELIVVDVPPDSYMVDEVFRMLAEYNPAYTPKTLRVMHTVPDCCWTFRYIPA